MTRLLIVLFVTFTFPALAVQYGVPISDQNLDVGWNEIAGDGNGTAWEEFDEGIDSGTPDDATTSWEDSDPSSAEVYTSNITILTDPEVSTGHIGKHRFRKDAADGRQVDVDLRIMNISSPTCGQERTNNISNTWATTTDTCSAAEADLFTNYEDLAISTRFFEVGGGGPRDGELTAHEFECPDAPAGGDDTITIFIGVLLTFWRGLL